MKKWVAYCILVISGCISCLAVEQSAVSSIFVHGWGGSWKQSCYYAYNNMAMCGTEIATSREKTDWYILPQPVYSFNFPHVYSKPARKYVSLAQELEINALKAACDEIQGPKILMGVSLGAATVINYTSLHYTPDIKAIIMETPFDEAEVVLKYQLGSLFEGLKHVAHATMAPAYDPAGIKPVCAVEQLPKELPILLIHASTDELIPLKCSRHLYYHLVKSGHTHVHLLELADGKHVHYIFGKDAQKYQETVHAFYKKYNLPHDEALACAGKQYLDDTQPPAW